MNERTVPQLFDLTGKAALVTGGTGWLGQAFSRALAEVGATVVISSRDLTMAVAAAAALPAKDPARHQGVAIDQMDPKSIAVGFQQAIEAVGRIDVLVNNGLEHVGQDWTDIPFDAFARHQVNNAGYFELARLVRNHAVSRSAPASVINIGSMYGQVGSYPDTYQDVCTASSVAYHALKGGTIQMTRHLAVYWAPDQVRVNCLSPGPFPNPDTAPQEMVQRLQAKSPLRRMGQPWELKGALVYLASDASSYVTGQNLTVDGGWTAW
jgi:gluconate 5-dehydrogenase